MDEILKVLGKIDDLFNDFGDRLNSYCDDVRYRADERISELESKNIALELENEDLRAQVARLELRERSENE